MNGEINRLERILQSCLHVIINWEPTMLLSENSTSESEVSENMLKNRFFVMKTSRPWSNWISCYFLRKFTKSISEYTVLSFVGIHKEHFQTMLISFIGIVFTVCFSKPQYCLAKPRMNKQLVYPGPETQTIAQMDLSSPCLIRCARRQQ
jgi:ABC-type phosphate/phosphonate transport system permease subunit